MSTEPEMHPLLVEMRGMRSEMAAMREQNAATFKRLGDVLDVVRRIEGDIRSVRSDIVLLENSNLNRHNEIMGVVARLDREASQ